jgi:hypothetical protein
MSLLSKDVLGLIVQNLDSVTDLMHTLNALPNSLRPVIFKRLFEVEYPYTQLDDIPEKNLENTQDYESGYWYMTELLDGMPKVPKEYKKCIINRRKNRSLMIPVNLRPEHDIFQHFLNEFKDEYIQSIDFQIQEYKQYFTCLSTDKLYQRKTECTTDTVSDETIYELMLEMLTNFKLPQERRYLFSQMLVEHNLIPLIPRVGDCIIDLNTDFGYREHGKYWCLNRDGSSFNIVGCDTKSYSDYGTIPNEFSFPRYSPEYFWDIVSYNKVLPIDINHPEIKEQLEQKKNNMFIELKTTNPIGYLVAKTQIMLVVDSLNPIILGMSVGLMAN